jgi:hypothetical protein
MLRPECAVLVLLRRASEANPTNLSGRAEHVTSGRYVEFSEPDELVAFLRETNVPKKGGPP